MVDTVTIVRPSATASVFNPSDGSYTDPADTDVYSGSCRVQISDGFNAQDADAGGDVLTVQRLTLQLPVAVTGVQIGDVATIDTAVFDGDLVGRVYRVVATHAKTHATARRLQCEEIR